eukprot:scaffold16212_cov78-Skeletonema_marinoi.AAC.1
MQPYVLVLTGTGEHYFGTTFTIRFVSPGYCSKAEIDGGMMKAPYPLPSPDSVEEKGGAPRAGGAIPSPRRHDMKQWLH